MSLTTDPNDPDIRRGPPTGDTAPVSQNTKYLVLSAEERAKGFLKPVRNAYVHTSGCGGTTTMRGPELPETYARDPWFYGATYCTTCQKHRPLAEFIWTDGEPMDPKKWPEEEHKRIDLLLKSAGGLRMPPRDVDTDTSTAMAALSQKARKREEAEMAELHKAQADETDAERYRWLRAHIAPTIIKRINKTIDDLRPEVLDATIDAYAAVKPSVVRDGDIIDCGARARSP